MVIGITGANGHVGVNLCKKLVSAGHEVRAFVHEHDQALRDIPVKIYRGDLLSTDSLKDFCTGTEILFHLAAKISISGDPDKSVFELNARGTRNIVETARMTGIKRMIHFSSIHAFQQLPHHIVLDEKRSLVGKEAFAYDCSKAEGERIVLSAAADGFDAVVLSPTAIIGPMDPEPGLMGKAFLQIYHQKVPALVPGGYDMVDVRDIVDASVTAMEKAVKGEKYLLSGKWHSIREISVLIEEFTGVKTVKTEMPFWVARAGLPFITLYSKLLKSQPLYTGESLTIIDHAHRNISNDKARKELFFRPRDIRESIRDVMEWFKNNKFLERNERAPL
ncbi:MAG: NAD-dependent epimerase/dehydratase family protein [Syntrophothermus sp.]